LVVAAFHERCKIHDIIMQSCRASNWRSESAGIRRWSS
jgi:hypothetical protein